MRAIRARAADCGERVRPRAVDEARGVEVAVERHGEPEGEGVEEVEVAVAKREDQLGWA